MTNEKQHIALGTFHVVITFQVDPEQFEELFDKVSEFLKKEVSRNAGFLSAKFHTNKERNILINYATWKSQEHYESYKASTGTITELAKKVLSFNPVGHEVWHILN
ncbi:hypothetical protein GW915_09045 [bacterium]|nr:hypothetical protein [bacterium]